MSEATKSRKCEDCGHIFEYALWASTCPNCTSTNLQVVDGPPPKAKKREVHLVSDAPVVDPKRHIPEVKLIHHEGVRETHLEIPEGGIELVIDEESRPRPTSQLLQEVKLILDESSEHHESKLNLDEIELLIMEVEDQYRPDPDAPPAAPMTPEEIAKAAVKRRIERMKAREVDLGLPPVSADGAVLPPISVNNGESPPLSFSRKSQRLDRPDSAAAPIAAAGEKKGFLSRRKSKVEEPMAPTPRKTMFQNPSSPPDFTVELAPNLSRALPEIEEPVFAAPRAPRNPSPVGTDAPVVGKRELRMEEEKGKREIPNPVAQQPIAPPPVQQPVVQQPIAPPPVQQPVAQQLIAPPPVQQPVAQQPIAPPPVQQPVAQQPIAPPLVQQPVVQQPIAPPPVQQPVAQQPIAPPPVQQPVVQQSIAPPPVQQPVAEPAPMENTARRRFNLPPIDDMEDDFLPPITADGKPIPPIHQTPDPANMGIGKKPRLQPPPQPPVKKGFFKKKK